MNENAVQVALILSKEIPNLSGLEVNEFGVAGIFDCPCGNQIGEGYTPNF